MLIRTYQETNKPQTFTMWDQWKQPLECWAKCGRLDSVFCRARLGTSSSCWWRPCAARMKKNNRESPAQNENQPRKKKRRRIATNKRNYPNVARRNPRSFGFCDQWSSKPVHQELSASFTRLGGAESCPGPFPTAFMMEKKKKKNLSLRTPTKEKEKEKHKLWNCSTAQKWNSTGAPWSSHTLCSSTFIPKMLWAMQVGFANQPSLLPWWQQWQQRRVHTISTVLHVGLGLSLIADPSSRGHHHQVSVKASAEWPQGTQPRHPLSWTGPWALAGRWWPASFSAPCLGFAPSHWTWYSRKRFLSSKSTLTIHHCCYCFLLLLYQPAGQRVWQGYPGKHGGGWRVKRHLQKDLVVPQDLEHARSGSNCSPHSCCSGPVCWL